MGTGVGHVRERKDRAAGTWELRVYAGRDPLTGRKVYRSKTIRAASRREADRALVAFAATVLDGQAPAGTITVGELLERWHAANAGDWSPATAYQTRWTIDRRLAGLHDRPLAQLRAVDLDAFYAALRDRGGKDGAPLAASSVIRTHGVLHLALDQAVRWQLIPTNPADHANPGRARKPKIVPPKAAEVLAILEAAEADDPELLTFLFLDAETGARRGELAALRLDDFGADTVTIARALTIGSASPETARAYPGRYWPSQVSRGERRTALVEKDPKTPESVRTIALSPATLDLVRTQAARCAARLELAGAAYPADGFLFPADGDGTRPLRPDTWTHRYTRLRDRLGLTVRLHDLRHFVATTLLTSGMDLATVAGRLGHGGGGKTTLAIYAHFLKEPDRAASELMAGVLRPAESPLPDNVVQIRRSDAQ